MDRGDTLGNKINWQETSKALGEKQKMLGGAENNRALKGEMAISLWERTAISLWGGRQFREGRPELPMY